ncbi:MAG TPA: hypothetical protein VIV60_15165 [Polyangiaceae bacterium]
MTDTIRLAVAGAHLSGMPLNHELVELRGSLKCVCRTSGEYTLHALKGTVPAKPALVRRPGAAHLGIEVEVWEMSAEAFGQFVAKVPSPMTIGTIELEDGSLVKGFLCEPFALEASIDITEFGGWRNYVQKTPG